MNKSDTITDEKKKCQIVLVNVKLQEIIQRQFTGQVEIHFYKGGINCLNVNERITLDGK